MPNYHVHFNHLPYVQLLFWFFCLDPVTSEFHAELCQHPEKSGKTVLLFLQSQEKTAKEDKKLFDSLFNLLSFEKITLNDLQFRPFRTGKWDTVLWNLKLYPTYVAISDEYIHKLFYETARFSAFNLQWVVKARVTGHNDDQRDPTQSCERQLSFQLSLKSKLATPMTIHYMILKVCTATCVLKDILRFVILGSIWRYEGAAKDFKT